MGGAQIHQLLPLYTFEMGLWDNLIFPRVSQLNLIGFINSITVVLDVFIVLFVIYFSRTRQVGEGSYCPELSKILLS